MMRRFMMPAFTLASRELKRFFRQPSRVLGVVGSPILFWFVIGSGLGDSFRFPSAPPTMDYLEYFFPGTLILIILFTAIFSTISIIEDRREGFLQSVLVSPVPRSAIVLGKVLGVTLLSLLQAAFVLLLIPFSSISVTILALVVTVSVLFAVAFSLASLGFLIAWRMDSTQGFHAVMNLLLIPMWMLSGALFPVSGAAQWVSWVMQLNPLAYGVAATRIALYGFREDYMRDLPSFVVSVSVVILFAVVAFVAAVFLVRKRQQGARVNVVLRNERSS